jgi:hypothetical protein
MTKATARPAGDSMNFHAACARLRLLLSIAVHRRGTAPCLAWALVAGLAVAFAALAAVASQQGRRLQAAEAAAAVVPALAGDAPGEPPLLQALRSAEPPLAALRRITELARGLDITLQQGDFQATTHPRFAGGVLAQTRMTLPLRAPYPQIKAFVYALLRELPAASLDQLVLRRGAAGDAHIDATLTLSLWSLQAPSAPAGEPPR